MTDKLVKLIGPESVVGVSATRYSISLIGERGFYSIDANAFDFSAPSSSMLALMTSERVTTRSLSRLVTLVPDLPAV